MTGATLPTATVSSVLRAGLPTFVREGFVPLGAFYIAQRAAGLGAGVAAAIVVSIIEYLLARRAGREGLLVRLSLAWVLVQSAAGVLADSATVYLAAPLLPTTVWGIAFVASASTPRPLAGALATAWYPFPSEYREAAAFQRVFRVESVVWGTMLLARSGLRLGFLLTGADIGDFVVLTFITGVPLTVATLAWSIRYAIANLPPAELEDPVLGLPPNQAPTPQLQAGASASPHAG